PSRADTALSISGSIRTPNGVGVTPRGERVNKRSPRCSSGLAIPFDSAGWVIPYARAAALNAPVSSTDRACLINSGLSRSDIHAVYRRIHKTPLLLCSDQA